MCRARKLMKMTHRKTLSASVAWHWANYTTDQLTKNFTFRGQSDGVNLVPLLFKKKMLSNYGFYFFLKLFLKV